MSFAFLEVYSLPFMKFKYILRICIDEAFNRKVSSWIQVFSSFSSKNVILIPESVLRMKFIFKSLGEKLVCTSIEF